MEVQQWKTRKRWKLNAQISVSCDDRGTTYAVYSADGELEDSGTEWPPLVKRFEAEFGDAPESLSIIWP